MKNSARTFVLIVSILAAALPLSGAWTIRRLTHDAGSSLLPRIAVQETNAYVVWMHNAQATSHIRFMRSTDRGATWERFKRLSADSDGLSLANVAAVGSSVYVVWYESTGKEKGEYFFRRSLNGGKTWQATRLLRRSIPQQCLPAIAASGSSIYVAWRELVETDVIYFRMSADGGATWQKERWLASYPWPSFVDSPVLAAFGSSVYAAWQFKGGSQETAVIHFMRSGDRGASWRKPQLVGFSKGWSFSPQIVASGPNLRLAWSTRETWSNLELWLSRSPDRGDTWKVPQRMTKNKGLSSDPALAADGSNLYLAWSDETPGNPEIFFRASADGGATWAGPMRITQTAGRSYRPAIAADGSNVYLVWYDDTPGNSEVYFGVRRW